MSFFTRLNTKITPIMNKCIFRYYHHHDLTIIPNYTIQKNTIIINLLGDRKSVDTASWEINSFAQEKSLNTANIVYEHGMLQALIRKNNILQFIVNRCYNMSCQHVLYLNNDIINTNKNWVPYNLYVMPDAKNRFNTCDFIRNCNHSNIILYPLAASEESKRRDINILIG